ncbi:hypothetical protein M409DRAFT_58155 [Zasmidium cellare ATCC 36951]|uniref:Uncharacterized protein n=1 Tax=Zasmidium cellare ATCC 36951 TaxID=1080233 RepID=A0A6A6C945_ZASCE|nr:uncharacterized protein M409DRAFT_58155 [Zasmidium cellare ATCC 36951]KAF2162760.1 hypothetical protein M409DRAFT_58155 [Zasmidium cellare ATCC 36951]
MKSFVLAPTLLALALSTTAHPTETKRSGSPLAQSQAQSRLESAGIYAVSSGGCTTKSNPKCTSYEGILSGTVDGAITLKGACGCDVTVTGGTETGHASGTYSHGNGYKLDFRKNTALNNYVTNSFTRIGNRGDGYPQWQSAAGNIYCDEGNHWDVLYY